MSNEDETLIAIEQEILAKAGLGSVDVHAPYQHAIQHLAKCIAFKRFGYRVYDRELIEHARQCAKRVLETGRAESLSPMNAFERKIVHTELTSYGNLETQSIGTEPNRRVVIKRASF